MAVAAAFVVSASFIAEHSGPVIGALVATLPISAGPAYVFLALDHDAAFIAQGAITSLPINAATIFLGLTYTVLAQRHNLFISYGSAGRRAPSRLGRGPEPRAPDLRELEFDAVVVIAR